MANTILETSTKYQQESVFGSTPRTQQLKKDLVSKACYGGKYIDGSYVDIMRASLYMQGDIKYAAEEPVIRRAKTLKHVLSNIPISILNHELIVGNPHGDPYALPIFPEINVNLLSEAVEDGYVRTQDRANAEELIHYWKGRTIASKVEKNLDPWIKDIVNTSSSFISTTWKDGIQHCVPNWNYVFENGTDNIRRKIQAKLKDVSNEISHGNSTELSNLINTRDLYESMLISLEALNIFTDRFSHLASEMAKNETDSARVSELQHMAGILSHVLKRTPESFHEACQGFFFLHLILGCIDSAAFGSLCRIDQCIWPYYEKDVLIDKTLTEAQAQELIENLILKVQGLGAFFSRNRRMHFEGNGALPIWTVGGIHEDGSDACNDLTEVVLKAARCIHCNQPTISILYHVNMRNGALEEAIKTIRTGLGYPSLTNTDWAIKSLLRQKIPLEAARNAGVVGCVSLCPVDSCNTTKRLALTIIAAKVLELALNEGKCLISGKRLGPEEKPAREFHSYEDVVAALEKQLIFAIRTAVNVRNLARHYEIKYRPNPLASALHRSPLETGKDVVSYEDYPNNYWLNLVGVINVVNSLIVIKKLVFEEKKYTMENILHAMRTDWNDLEAMRQEVIQKVPKYGNDDPYADNIARDIFNLCSNIGEHTYDINGGFWSVLAQSVSIYQATAKLSGALPDGKRIGTPLADGGISPDHGTDNKGMFTVINSASKIKHFNTKGLLLNQWIAPEMLAGQEGIDRMKAIIKMWHEKELSQFQINVVDPKILLDAQLHPEKYPHLTIRVSGYTANWVKLSKELQDMILSRTLQKF